MKRSALISDIIFAFFACFLCTLVFFRALRISLFFSILLAAVCGVLSASATAALLQRKRKTVFLKRSDETQKEKLLFYLSCLSDEEKTRFFLSRLSLDGSTIHRQAKLRLASETKFYLLHFTFSPVNADEVAAFSRWKTQKEKVLLCNKIEEQAYTLAERLRVRILTGNEVYAYLKDNNGLPTSYGEESAEKKRERRFNLWFSKKNAKPFLISAGLILLTSFISPFRKYYLVFGFLLFTASILIRIFGKK